MDNMNKRVGLYKIVNKINGKFYIGSSNNIRDRFYNHKSQLNRNIHDNLYLQRAWNKYGKDNFEFGVLRECNPNVLIIEEQKELNTHFGDKSCYNLSPSADVPMRGIPRSDEIKHKISLAQKGKPRWTNEQKKQMSIDRKGKKPSKETIEKFRNRQKSCYTGIIKAQQMNVGRIYSKNHCNNISLTKKLKNKTFSEKEIKNISMGVKKAILEGRYHKNKLKYKEKEISNLYLSGIMNKRQLSIKYGVCPNSIDKLLKRTGI